MNCEAKGTVFHMRRMNNRGGRAFLSEEREDRKLGEEFTVKKKIDVFNVLTHARCCSKYLSAHNDPLKWCSSYP